MSQKIKKITNRKDLAGLEKAYKTIFRSASTTNDPFQPEIEQRAVLFYHPYALDEKYLRAIGQSAIAIGDSNIAYVSLIEGFSGNDFNNRYHWSIDLMNYPYDKLRKDEDWFPLMENAIYSKKGVWGIIFSEVGYAILGGSKQFFCALQKNVPNLDEEVYDFLKYMKERIEKSPNSVEIIKSWLPSLLAEIYGLKEAEKMLEQVELSNMLEAL